MLKCPNCASEVNEKWKHCTKCGTNLEDSTYSSSDDPLDKINSKVDRIDQFLTEKFPEDLDDNEPPNDDTKKRKKAAAKKRKTLFGD